MTHRKCEDFACGPLQIVHDFKFTALNVKDDYSIIDRLDYTGKVENIKARIDRLHRLGYGGVVMNVDYKEYLKKAEAFDLFFECAEYAKGLGMRVWIYDEQYYPSGAAGGLTLEGHPELEAVALACISKDVKVDETTVAIRISSPTGYSELKYAVAAPISNGEIVHTERIIISDRKDLGGGLCFHAPIGEWRIWCFFVRPLFEKTKFTAGTRASRRYISVFNKSAIERFYDVTFEHGYSNHYCRPLSEIVDAVFTDEPYSPFYTNRNKLPGRTFFPSESIYDDANDDVPIYPYVPWEMTVPAKFKERYGRDIVESLPDIFDNTPKTKSARIDFYTLLSDMAKEAFPEQMAERLGREGVLLSGHYYGEEGFDFQPAFYGDILEHLSIMGIPGCDCLWSEMDVLRYSTACKLASSAAHLALKKDVMIEASNMIDKDQNITLEKAKAAISAMFINGITQITSYYGEHILSDDEMQKFTRHITALSRLFRDGKYKINTLLYYPFENLCADCAPQGIVEGNDNGEDHLKISSTSATLMKHQVCFDFINKEKLLSCEMCDGYIKTPNGEMVKYIVFPDIPWLDDEVCAFVNEAHKRGVEIIFDGNKRYIRNVLFANKFICDGNYPTSELSLVEENPYITVMERAFNEHDLFMLMNTDNAAHSITAKINIKDGDRFDLVNHLTKEITTIKPHIAENEAYLSINIPALEPVIIKRSAFN